MPRDAQGRREFIERGVLTIDAKLLHSKEY
jgi:hypothetical protein